MCRVITPDQGGGHGHTDDPLSIAELLRESLSQELDALTELAARHHIIEDDEVRHVLGHLIDSRRKDLAMLWSLLQQVEDKAFGEHQHGH
ncbi:MAG: hypothetical protein WC948_03805 [Thermovirgaceae bacterium]|nr:hypothetical protein [Thermovirga sp.]